jgi:hypothetical protein
MKLWKAGRYGPLFFVLDHAFSLAFSALNASVIRYRTCVSRCCAGTFLPTVVFLWMITPWAWAAVSAVAHDPPSHGAATLASLPSRVEIASSSAALAIPEPVSLAVFAMGILLLFRRRRF